MGLGRAWGCLQCSHSMAAGRHVQFAHVPLTLVPPSVPGPGGKRERDADGASMNAEEEAPAVVSPAARANRGSLGQRSTEDGQAPTLDTSCAAAAPSPVGCMVYVSAEWGAGAAPEELGCWERSCNLPMLEGRAYGGSRRSPLQSSRWSLPMIALPPAFLQVVDDLKAPVLNDIVTVVGILSIVPELAACCQVEMGTACQAMGADGRAASWRPLPCLLHQPG